MITEVDGIKFHSKKEAQRYLDLKVLRANGDVLWFIRQVPFYLSATEEKYLADFLIVWATGAITVEDVKGVRTKDYLRKKKLVLKEYGVDIVET